MAAPQPTAPNYGTQPVAPSIYPDLPPSYDTSGAPPSYDSLYGEFREVRDPKTFGTVFAKILNFLLGTTIALIILALVNCIPLALIIIGSININNCPAEPYIPIWMVVMGSVSIFKSLLNCLYKGKRLREGRHGENYENLKPNPCDGLISCFLFGWFIAGSVWVYSNWGETSPLKGAANYCDDTTILFSFWVLTLTYIFLVLFIFFSCCCGCCAICFGRRRSGADATLNVA